MTGSKYDDATREKALAMCASPKMTAAKVAAAMGIPRSTVYDWQRTAQENDPDFIAARRNKLRSLMDRAYAIVGRSLDGLDAQSKALRLEKKEIDRILLKILADNELDEETRRQMVQIVQEYTGTSMTDLVRVAKDTLGIFEKLEGKLTGEEQEHVIQLTFAESSMGDLAR